MAKLTLTNVTSFQNDNSAVTTYNNNNNSTEVALENTLSRDGTSPNQMNSNLDMNSWHILNLPIPSSDNDPVRLIDLTNVSQVTNVLHTASSTSVLIGTGNKTFTVPSGRGFFPGQFILVQYAIDNTQYMIGRVVSYAGTTLVVNSTAFSGSGTFANWLIDLSGPPGPVSVIYDTKATAAAATIPGTVSFLNLAGYTTVGDGGNGLYKRQVSNPGTTTGSFFQSVDGAYWLLVSRDITPEMFGCLGDATTDDRANFQNAIDYTSARGGGWIQLSPNKSYRILNNNQSLNGKPGVGIRYNGSAINLENSGGSLGLRMHNNMSLIGPGTHAVTSATGVGGSQSMYLAAISFGELNGNEGTVGSPSALTTINNILIDGLTISSVRNDNLGSVVQGYGGVHDITIQNCTFPNNSGTALGIGFDWGFYGALSSANIALSATNYNAGTAYSIHPHNIRILNNQMGVFSSSAGTAIRTSGCYNFDIRNNTIAGNGTTGAGIFTTGGDLGFEFAPTAERLNACINMKYVGNNLKGCLGMGFYHDAFPDNVYDAVVNPANPSYPYTPIGLYEGYPVDSLVQGNNFISTAFSGNTLPGLWLQFSKGIHVVDNKVYGFVNGIDCKKNLQDALIERNDVSYCTGSGISVSDTNPIPANITVRNNKCYNNTNTNAALGNIYINGVSNVRVENNIIGLGTELYAVNGIKIDTGALNVTITGNTVNSVRAGGTAFALPLNLPGIILAFKDNTYSGAGTFVTGLTILPYMTTYSMTNPGQPIVYALAGLGAMTSGVTPTYGTWTAGSEITNIDAATTGQVYKTKCTVSGSPGTWKAMVTSP